MADYWLTVRARLQGAKQFASDAALDSAAITEFGDATKVAGDQAAFATEKTFLLGEEMYSLRRYGFYAITAVGLTGAAVLKMGYDFDEAKDKGVTAFTAILGSSAKARAEVNALQKIATETGQSFDNLVAGARTMTTFGFSVKQTNSYLRDFANYTEFKGLGATGFNSLIGVFDQIQNTGRFTSRNLLSLQGLGVPLTALTQGLGLSQAQVFQLQHGTSWVPSSVAIPQLAQWLQNYAGSQPASLGTEFDRFRQTAAAGVGRATAPAWSWLQRSLPGITGAVQSPPPQVAQAWIVISNAVKALATSVRVLFTVLQPLMLTVLIPLGGILDLLAKHTLLVRLAVYGLAAAYIATRGPMLAVWLITKAQAIAYGLLWAAQALYLRGLYVLEPAQWSLNVAMDENPVGALIVGFSALALGVGVLIWKMQALRQEFTGWFDDIENFAKRHPVIFGLILGGPIGGLVGGVLGHVPGVIPHLAGGGNITRGGRALVGENGPEILNLPTGAQVVPLGRGGGTAGTDTGQIVAAFVQALRGVQVPVYLDKQKVGEGVFEYQSNVAALA